ncbi:MAG: hypothetical protein KGQ59_03725 [Bdellovibrionales bacterium]|nr:hypothetical protein [Bdellovibrionales bacterium]
MMKQALAIELAALGRYKSSYFSALDLNDGILAQSLISLSEEVEEDIDQILEKILDLGGAAQILNEYQTDSQLNGDVLPTTLTLRNCLSEVAQTERLEVQEYHALIQALEGQQPHLQQFFEQITQRKNHRANRLEKSAY